MGKHADHDETPNSSDNNVPHGTMERVDGPDGTNNHRDDEYGANHAPRKHVPSIRGAYGHGFDRDDDVLPELAEHGNPGVTLDARKQRDPRLNVAYVRKTHQRRHEIIGSIVVVHEQRRHHNERHQDEDCHNERHQDEDCHAIEYCASLLGSMPPHAHCPEHDEHREDAGTGVAVERKPQP